MSKAKYRKKANEEAFVKDPFKTVAKPTIKQANKAVLIIETTIAFPSIKNKTPSWGKPVRGVSIKTNREGLTLLHGLYSCEGWIRTID